MKAFLEVVKFDAVDVITESVVIPCDELGGGDEPS